MYILWEMWGLQVAASHQNDKFYLGLVLLQNDASSPPIQSLISLPILYVQLFRMVFWEIPHLTIKKEIGWNLEIVFPGGYRIS